MLRSLSIRDFVIVDRMALEFERGFTVLSGETGAGKSILVDALALLLGERGDALAVRHGAERAELNAEFDLQALPSCVRWLDDNELSEEGACLVRRVIDTNGRSRAFINGRAATLSQLKALGEFLVDIHGQHQHQSLLRTSAQRELLDGYGELSDLGREVGALYREWQKLREQRTGAERDAETLSAERERLEWQVNELEALKLSADEWQALLADHACLAHASRLIETAQLSIDALGEADDSALSRLNAVIGRLESVLEYDARLKSVLEMLEPARIQLQEACSAIRHYADKVDTDPQRQREVEQRIESVHNAARKYRVRPEQLSELLVQGRTRLSEMAAIGDIETLRRLEVEAQSAYEKAARRLTGARKKAAAKLAAEVTEAMQTLAMAGGAFDIALTAREPGAYGMEDVEFRVAAHKGMAPQSLSRVASGGELSRISLAIQTVTSRVAHVPTLIFDEVDAGIGGRVAEIVGRMLKQLGKRHQVMCITHLPQVAASADHQWLVRKATGEGKVSSSVTVLDGRERVDEIARMLGGLKITETTRRHAAEMLGVKI